MHLNETGCRQAEKIADFLQENLIKAIFASPLERTMETAAPLAQRLNLTVTPAEALKEINFGELQGLGEELITLPVWEQFNAHPAEVAFPGGESIREAQQRVVVCLNKLAENFSNEDQIACFAHCEILRLAIAYALHIPLDNYMRLTIDPASITCLDWKPENGIAISININV